MKKFYIYTEDHQQGPFSEEDLREKNITRETMIWFEGAKFWIPAGKTDELKEFFRTVPPSVPSKEPINPLLFPGETAKRNFGLQTFLTIIGLLIIVVVIFIISQNKPDSVSPVSVETYPEKVMTVEEIERSQPANFLDASGEYRENFWGNKIKVTCVISNKATVASYKDAVVKITYYSKTKTELGSKEYTLYENFPPHSKKSFEIKIENFQNVAAINWDVIDATPN